MALLGPFIRNFRRLLFFSNRVLRLLVDDYSWSYLYTMNLPFFYSPGIVSIGGSMELEEENARHIVQVLRMKAGDTIKITDGKGNTSQCMISATGKKSCTVLIQSQYTTPPPVHKVTVAISLLKNTGRFEWFLEKAAESGVYAVIPIICQRTEKQAFRESRLKSILISAMLQSQQSWLTELSSPVNFNALNTSGYDRVYIAHCDEEHKKELSGLVDKQHVSSLIMIGPEGDFTPAEISAAIASGAVPVQLGETRLRSETAGITAAIILKQLGG